MNRDGITVPGNYKHLMTKEHKSTEDYKAQIRHFIETRPKVALTNADFQKLLGTTSAMSHVKRLMKQGYVTRARVYGKRGKQFSYKWHDQALDYEKAAVKNGVLTTKLDLPEFKLKGLLNDLDQLAYEWQDTRAQPGDGEYIIGVLEFRKWLRQKEREVAEKRRVLIDEHIAGHTTVALGDAAEAAAQTASE